MLRNLKIRQSVCGDNDDKTRQQNSKDLKVFEKGKCGERCTVQWEKEENGGSGFEIGDLLGCFDFIQ